MEYERKVSGGAAHIYTFDNDWEIRVVKAAYLERSNLFLEKGNYSLIKDTDKDVSLSHPKKSPLVIKSDTPDRVANILEEFSNRTEDEVFELSHSQKPRYKNYYSLERMVLGEWALCLANTVRKAVREFKISDDEIIEQFQQELEHGIPED